MHENILLEETFGNCDDGPGPGPRAILVSQHAVGWQVVKSEHNWNLQFLWNILVFVCLEAQLFNGKGTFSLADSNTSCSLGPYSLLRCWLLLWKRSLCLQCKEGAVRLGSTWYYENKFPFRFWFASELHHKTIYYWHKKIRIVKPSFSFSLVGSSLFTFVCTCTTPQKLLKYRSQQHNNGEFITWQTGLCYNNSFKS